MGSTNSKFAPSHSNIEIRKTLTVFFSPSPEVSTEAVALSKGSLSFIILNWGCKGVIFHGSASVEKQNSIQTSMIINRLFTPIDRKRHIPKNSTCRKN